MSDLSVAINSHRAEPVDRKIDTALSSTNGLHKFVVCIDVPQPMEDKPVTTNRIAATGMIS